MTDQVTDVCEEDHHEAESDDGVDDADQLIVCRRRCDVAIPVGNVSSNQDVTRIFGHLQQ